MSQKKILTLFIIASLFLFSSCDKIENNNKQGTGIFMSEDKRADMRMEQIVAALKDKDKDALKLMFSAQVLAQSIDFEDQMTYLFEFIQGDIESWERTGGPGVSEGQHDDGSGRIWKEIRATYDIKTSEQKYHISLQEITKHSQDAGKVGVGSFCIINAEDWGEEYNYWGDLGLPEDFKTLGIVVDLNLKDIPQE